MGMFGESGFDANAKENNETNVLPAGDYDVVLVKSEQKTTKDGTGKYLSLDFQVTTGERQNAHIFTNLNLWLKEIDDKKRTAVKIAKAQLSELCRAVNVLNPKDAAELHNKPLRVKVAIREASGEFPAQNNITKFKPREFNAVAPPPMQPMATASADAPTSGSPW